MRATPPLSMKEINRFTNYILNLQSNLVTIRDRSSSGATAGPTARAKQDISLAATQIKRKSNNKNHNEEEEESRSLHNHHPSDDQTSQCLVDLQTP